MQRLLARRLANTQSQESARGTRHGSGQPTPQRSTRLLRAPRRRGQAAWRWAFPGPCALQCHSSNLYLPKTTPRSRGNLFLALYFCNRTSRVPTDIQSSHPSRWTFPKRAGIFSRMKTLQPLARSKSNAYSTSLYSPRATRILLHTVVCLKNYQKPFYRDAGLTIVQCYCVVYCFYPLESSHRATLI